MANPNPKTEHLIRFEKGNKLSKGRPKGSISFPQLLMRALKQEIPMYDADGTKQMKPIAEVIVSSWIKGAVNGDIKHINSIVDRLDGKPIQQVQQDNTHHWEADLSSLTKEQLNDLYKANSMPYEEDEEE